MPLLSSNWSTGTCPDDPGQGEPICPLFRITVDSTTLQVVAIEVRWYEPMEQPDQPTLTFEVIEPSLIKERVKDLCVSVETSDTPRRQVTISIDDTPGGIPRAALETALEGPVTFQELREIAISYAVDGVSYRFAWDASMLPDPFYRQRP